MILRHRRAPCLLRARRGSPPAAAPIAASRGARLTLVSSGAIGILALQQNVSRVQAFIDAHGGVAGRVSPLAMAHWIGAAPRYFGNSEACRLMLPCAASRASIAAQCDHSRRSTMHSGAIASSCARNSALFLIFSGCATASPSSSALLLYRRERQLHPRGPWDDPAASPPSAMSCPAAISASSGGTANMGVPQ